jgi:hypothetical protein
MMTRATLWTTKMVAEGHIFGTKMVSISVDFETRIEALVKQMQDLMVHLDPFEGLITEVFGEIPGGEIQELEVQPDPSSQSATKPGTSRAGRQHLSYAQSSRKYL